MYGSHISDEELLFRAQSGLRAGLRRAGDGHAPPLPPAHAVYAGHGAALRHDRHGVGAGGVPPVLRRGERKGTVHRGAELRPQCRVHAPQTGQGEHRPVRADPVDLGTLRHGGRGVRAAPGMSHHRRRLPAGHDHGEAPLAAGGQKTLRGGGADGGGTAYL